MDLSGTGTLINYGYETVILQTQYKIVHLVSLILHFFLHIYFAINLIKLISNFEEFIDQIKSTNDSVNIVDPKQQRH